MQEEGQIRKSRDVRKLMNIASLLIMTGVGLPVFGMVLPVFGMASWVFLKGGGI